jgi:hypothetical protein
MEIADPVICDPKTTPRRVAPRTRGLWRNSFGTCGYQPKGDESTCPKDVSKYTIIIAQMF